MSRSRKGLKVDGVLLLDKPQGVSSNGAVNLAKFLYKAQKAGHTGTLDPLATGLLPLCFGEATKFSSYFLESEKTYETTVRFGIKTTTGDEEGEILEERPVEFTEEDLKNILQRFKVKISQTPPMYSALKQNGVPLYKLARQGMQVEREPRNVEIFSLNVLSYENPFAKLRVCCSKGTYIRVLAEDIGEELGCGAHLTELRRTTVGAFSIDQSIDLEHLEEFTYEQRLEKLLPVDCLLASLATVECDRASAERFLHGNPIDLDGTASFGDVSVYEVSGSERILLGVGFLEPSGKLKPKRLIQFEKD